MFLSGSVIGIGPAPCVRAVLAPVMRASSMRVCHVWPTLHTVTPAALLCVRIVSFRAPLTSAGATPRGRWALAGVDLSLLSHVITVTRVDDSCCSDTSAWISCIACRSIQWQAHLVYHMSAAAAVFTCSMCALVLCIVFYINSFCIPTG